MVTLRPYRISDADALLEAARESTREVFPWLPWCHPDLSREEVEAWLRSQVEAWAQRQSFEHCILGEDGTYLGGVALNQIHRANRFGNVGYWVRSSATRRGVATAAVAQIVEFARRETDLIRLEIVVAAGNEASARVARKAGAVYEGTLRSRLFFHGAPHDAMMFSLLLPR